MTSIQLPDDILKQAGITEREAVVELACRLFETERLSLFLAARLAGVSQTEFEDILLDRKIPIYRYTSADLQSDLRTLREKDV
jgi:predicted HTH domain antitoxin